MADLINKVFLDSMFVDFPRTTLDDLMSEVNNVKNYRNTFNSLTKERMFKTKDGYTIHIPVPGIAKEDIRIKINNKKLEVEATRKYEGRPQAVYSTYYDLGIDINVDAITSKYNNGLLTIDIPLTKPKELSIDIKVE